MEHWYGLFCYGAGTIITNAHVVDGCKTLRVAPVNGLFETGRVLAVDKVNDLALLSIPTSNPPRYALLRSEISTGEDVTSYGFPLADRLPSSGNFTKGSISALAGLGDDFRMLQFSAPIQPGNSGGPLMDTSGNVVGVVVSKLNALVAFKENGDIPQNVNFAIKASVARIFLKANSVEAAEGGVHWWKMSAPDQAAEAKRFTVFIVCNH